MIEKISQNPRFTCAEFFFFCFIRFLGHFLLAPFFSTSSYPVYPVFLTEKLYLLYSRRRRFFVLLPLRDLNGRPSGDMTDQEVHQDIFAVGISVNQISQSGRQDLIEKNIVVLVVESRACQDHWVVVAPLGSVDPLMFTIVPKVTATRKSDQPIGKVTPNSESKIHLFSCQRSVFIQR